MKISKCQSGKWLRDFVGVIAQPGPKLMKVSSKALAESIEDRPVRPEAGRQRRKNDFILVRIPLWELQKRGRRFRPIEPPGGRFWGSFS
jgi:hypothetical protein